MEESLLRSSSISISSRRRLSSSFLSPLPEEDEIFIPPSFSSAAATCSSAFKERLIFGSPPAGDSDDTFIPIASSSPPVAPQDPLQPPAPFPNPVLSPSSSLEEERSWVSHQSFSKAKSNLHRSRTAPALSTINYLVDHHQSPLSKPRSGSIVCHAFILLFIYLAAGVLMYTLNRHHFSSKETHPVVDALYFCIVTMCTIGYGDITPKTTSAKLFSITFVLVGFGFVDILLSGMVSYVLDLQESHLLDAVKRRRDDRSYIFDMKKGRMRIRLKVFLALFVVCACIGLGTVVLRYTEKLGWLDSFYLSVMSVTTVGYGDRAFNSLQGRLFASIWLLVSTLAVARAFLYLAEARIDKRHRMVAKWALGRDMTVSEFLAADIDNNGFVTKSEFVVYKLKEMGKVAEKDITQICNQFDKLDTGNCGKITLSDLLKGHH